MSNVSSPSGPSLLKECANCKIVKSVEQFNTVQSNYLYKNLTYKPAKPKEYKRNICADCRAAQKRQQSLKWRYGITQDDYNEMLKLQNNACAICLGVCPTGKNLAVDHCHKTGKVRGLLCIRCNRGLGHFKDELETAERLVEYIRTKCGL